MVDFTKIPTDKKQDEDAPSSFIEDIKIEDKNLKEKIDRDLKKANEQEDTTMVDMGAMKVYLEKKEADLEAKKKLFESEVEKNLKNSLMLEKNWPFRFLRIARNDIENDIPEQKQLLIRRAYLLWILTSLALFLNAFNLLLVTFLSKNIVVAAMSNFLFGTFVFIVGTIIGWTCMYKRLYYAVREDNARLNWILFSITFSVHSIFIIYSILGLPSWATSGIFNLIVQLSPGGSWVVILFDSICILFWGCIGLLTYFIFKIAREKFNEKPIQMNNAGGFGGSNALFETFKIVA